MIKSPFEKRQDARLTGHHGRKAEEKTAKRLKGTLTPASGALAGAKGDMSVGDFLVENKATVSEAYSLKMSVLLKIYQEALEVGKKPALAVQFTSLTGTSEKRGRWVCIPEDVFNELIGG